MTTVSQLDYLVIGAGPAGLQLGYYLEKAGRNYLILESGDSVGTFFQRYPRHRQLISINKVYTGYDDTEINLRWDWNSLLCDDDALLFKHYSRDYFPNADRLVDYLQDFAKHYALQVKCNSQVVNISRDGDFRVEDCHGNLYIAKRVIIAAGFTQLYMPPIPGVELAEKYTEMSTDPEDFLGDRVLIIGKGNSAFETADALVSTTAMLHIVSRDPIKLAWKTKYVGHLRAVNNNVLDTYQLKSQNVVIDSHIQEIRKEGDEYVVTFQSGHAFEETDVVRYDRVLLCAGWQMDASIFDETCRPELAIDNRFPAQTSEWESTNIPDLYVAGTLMHMRDFKKKQSGFIHGFRYNVQLLAQILDRKYEQQEIPCASIAGDAETLTAALLATINRSSALWQQTGFLCAAVRINDDGTATYYDPVSVDYVHDQLLGEHDHYYTLTLEFGLDIIMAAPDPFALPRVHKEDVARADESVAIHPIVRRFSRGHQVAEMHVLESLDAEWKLPVHIEPLQAFLAEQIAGAPKVTWAPMPVAAAPELAGV
jgi:thioredoxin reductase